MDVELRRSVLVVACAAAILLAGASPSLDQSNQPPERFTAFAVSTGGVVGSGATTVEISVTRWSTDEERQRFIRTLQEKGPQELLDELRDAPEKGFLRTPDSLGYPIRYAHQEPLEDGGRQIVVATDRPISFWEQVNRPRTIDYPFTLIQMRIRPDGTGEGRMSIATRIIAHDNIIELENYDTQPVLLQQVRAQERR
jgi:hypothetical protein